MQYHVVPCNTVQYHAIPCNTVLREQQAKVSNFVKLYQNCVLQALLLLLVEKIPLMLRYVEEMISDD